LLFDILFFLFGWYNIFCELLGGVFMEHLSLYRKYRPSNFDEMVDQSYIVKTIKNSILNNKLSHAYLFYGPRGTGKTSMAKLVAKIVNCDNLIDFKPCDKCASCISINDKSSADVIEMDAASNNGVDEIREIRSRVNLLPNISKYKVYIIDEVHMLSIGAFNALLKTLEEPPSHVIFILATTEINKVPETILSRCQSFEFRRISIDGIVNRLKFISDAEALHVEDGVLELIGSYSNGGLRDSINMLDKLSSFSDNVTLDDFYRFKGISDPSIINDFVNNLLDSCSESVITCLDNFRNSGINYVLLINEILLNLRNRIVDNVKSNRFDNDILFRLVSDFNVLLHDVKDAIYANVIFEVGIFKLLCGNRVDISENDINLNKKDKVLKTPYTVVDETNINTLEKPQVSNDFVVEEADNAVDTSAGNGSGSSVFNNSRLSEKAIAIRVNNAFANADKSVLEKYRNEWFKFNDFVNNSEFSSVVSYLLDGVIRVAGPDYVMISVKYDSILNNAFSNLSKIESLFEMVFKNKCSLVFVLDSEWDRYKLDYVNNIKNGKKYVIIEENENDGIIDITAADSYTSAVFDDAAELFGSDIVEVR